MPHEDRGQLHMLDNDSDSPALIQPRLTASTFFETLSKHFTNHVHLDCTGFMMFIIKSIDTMDGIMFYHCLFKCRFKTTTRKIKSRSLG